MNRKQILEEFLNNVIRFSNKKYQERIWVKAEGPECNNIDDAVGDFFDDGDPILEKYKDFGITDSQLEILMKLRKKLREFEATYDVYYSNKSTNRLIKMPQWEKIRDLANEVLKAFNYQKTLN